MIKIYCVHVGNSQIKYTLKEREDMQSRKAPLVTYISRNTQARNSKSSWFFFFFSFLGSFLFSKVLPKCTAIEFLKLKEHMCIGLLQQEIRSQRTPCSLEEASY